jgi:hypothetical protein
MTKVSALAAVLEKKLAALDSFPEEPVVGTWSRRNPSHRVAAGVADSAASTTFSAHMTSTSSSL